MRHLTTRIGLAALVFLLAPLCAATNESDARDTLDVVGSIAYDADLDAVFPMDDGPLWIEVDGLHDPADTLPGHVWRGLADVSEDGSVRATLRRGVLARGPLAPELDLDYALKATALLPPSESRCASFCAVQAREEARERCDDRRCLAAEGIRLRDACEAACIDPDCFGLRGSVRVGDPESRLIVLGDLPVLHMGEVVFDALVDDTGDVIEWRTDER